MREGAIFIVMTNIIDRLDSLNSLACRLLKITAGAFMLGMMLLACANMLLRAVGEPIVGVFELMGFFGAVVTALSLGYSQLRRSHIAVGLLTRRFPESMRRFLDAVVNLAACGFFLLAGLETGKWAGFLVETGELSETLQIVYHPFVYAAAAGCLIMALILFTDFLKIAGGREKV